MLHFPDRKKIQMMKYTVAMGIIMLIVSQSKDMHLETRW